MRINYNLSAYTANAQLLKNEKNQASATERLASGFKINHAKDDPAGMAMSNKMKLQIDGLKQASQNSSDGISVIQTAEGCLNEVESILQRMRELSVQAANGTNDVGDREVIQEEIDSLSAEIDRISKNTEFNKKKLLDGSLDRRAYTDNANVRVTMATDGVQADKYGITVTEDARQAVAIGQAGDTADMDTGDVIAKSQEGNILINGEKITIREGDTASEVYEKIRDGAERAGVYCVAVDDTTLTTDGSNEEYAGYKPSTKEYDYSQQLVFISKEYGATEKINIRVSSDDLAKALGLVGGAPADSDNATDITVGGLDAKVLLSVKDKDPAHAGQAIKEGYRDSAAVKTSGNRITVTDNNGFMMEMTIDKKVCSGATVKDVLISDIDDIDAEKSIYAEVTAGTAQEIEAEVTDIGMMTVHVGANENQILDVDIPEVSVKTLRLENLSVMSEYTAGKAISKLDDAIERVSTVRARLGAFQNRLEHTVTSLNTSEEDLTSALSRITDVDMASEMTNFTQHSILTQAATSVLSQANDLPQQALQLIQ